MSFYSFDQGISTAEIPFIQPGTIALDSASPGHRQVSHFLAHHPTVIPAERLGNGLTSQIRSTNEMSYVCKRFVSPRIGLGARHFSLPKWMMKIALT